VWRIKGALEKVANFERTFMKTLVIFALITFTGLVASAETTQIAGKVNFADCSGVIAKPAGRNNIGKCVVSFSGVSEVKTASDGSRSTATYEGELAVMGQEMKPADLAGKNVFLAVDFKNSEITAWGPR
jgi:hypothetical protein